ncbi:hypothetical protein V8C35DRAFT_314404 [Trichoderma chlorosporum]
MPTMENTSATQPTISPSSSAEEAAEDTQTIPEISITKSPSFYPDCPICNPPDTKSVNVSSYGTIESYSSDSQSLQPTFLEASLEACAEFCCCICDTSPPSSQSSEWSSTPYPSSLSSNSYSYSETETASSQDQTTDTETIQAQNLPRSDDGYKRQQEMRSVKDNSILQYPRRIFQRSG